MNHSTPKVHTVAGTVMPVNAFLVETANGVVAVDTTLTMTDSQSVRAKIDELGKPLLGVLVTHAHPDHYAGLAQIIAEDDVPIVALDQVAAVIERDDAAKDQIVGPMMGPEWPTARPFPNQIVADGARVTFDGVTFTVQDVGAGESPANSVWIIEGETPIYFIGDLVYNEMHAYLADGFYVEWLNALTQAEANWPENAILYQGHGEVPLTKAAIAWQRAYIETFIAAVKASSDVADHQAVVEKMMGFLPSEALLFLMDLSIDPVKALLNE